jgi:Peptidase family S51
MPASQATCITLLGPQRMKPTLKRALEAHKIVGKVAVITAGWQERESDDTDIVGELDGRVVNLRLHARAGEIFAADAELKEAHRLRQERLMQLQEFYRLRLEGLFEAGRTVARRCPDAATLAEEQQLSLDAVRLLDRQHLERVAAVYAEFEADLEPDERDTVAKHRSEIAASVEMCDAVVIAGGHVAVLLNRMKLFGVGALVGVRPLVAWSAGAMAIAETVVLYHDSPPQGAGMAQVFDTGLGLCRGIVPLPSPRQRLRTDDPENISHFARRFAPAACVALGDGAMVDLKDGHFERAVAALRLDASGRLDSAWAA